MAQMHKHHPQLSLSCQEVVTYLEMELYSVDSLLGRERKVDQLGSAHKINQAMICNQSLYLAPEIIVLSCDRCKITLGRVMWKKTSTCGHNI